MNSWVWLVHSCSFPTKDEQGQSHVAGGFIWNIGTNCILWFAQRRPRNTPNRDPGIVVQLETQGMRLRAIGLTAPS